MKHTIVKHNFFTPKIQVWDCMIIKNIEPNCIYTEFAKTVIDFFF